MCCSRQIITNSNRPRVEDEWDTSFVAVAQQTTEQLLSMSHTNIHGFWPCDMIAHIDIDIAHVHVHDIFKQLYIPHLELKQHTVKI